MGEQSYLHRKLFQSSKLKRFKGQKTANLNISITSADNITATAKQQQQQSNGNIEQANTTKPSTSECDVDVSQDLQIRQQPATESPSPLASGVRLNDHHNAHSNYESPLEATTSQNNNNLSVDDALSSSQGTSNRTDSNALDHIETLEVHPDLPVITSPQQQLQISETAHKSKESKLRKATKAILLFKRATNSLTAHNDNSTSDRGHRMGGGGGGFRRNKGGLVASFWRQSTADNSTCTRSSRFDSFASSSNNNWSGSATPTPSSCLNGSVSNPLELSVGGGGGGGIGRHRKSTADAQSMISSTFTLPRFIVPKMNALRLPIVCLIKSLDGELMREIFIHRYELGQYLIDNLKVSLGMKDAKYFGLKLAKSIEEQEDVRQPWLDLNDSVYKQISKYSKSVNDSNSSGQQESGQTKSVDFYLRIKFYPPNLARIQDQFLKNYLWLQLKRDLRLGKLTSSMNNLIYLMACTLQYELGDYKQELVNEKLPVMNILPNQDLIEQQAIEIWKTRLRGGKLHQVQMQFLRASVILETYGFDYYPVRDHQRQRAYLLGFNYAGVKTIRNGRIIHHFRWNSLSKISYERRMIIFHIYPSENSKRKQILGFKCLSNEDCQNLYMRLLEQKYFFTVDLTYFDKSIRRPSCLTESTLGQQPEQQQQQQQLSDWTPCGPTDQAYNDEDEYNDVDDFDVMSEQSHPATNHQHRVVESSRSEPTQTSTSMHTSGRHQTHEPVPASQNSSDKIKPTSGAALDNCDCVHCKRDAHRYNHQQGVNNQSMESNSTGIWDGYTDQSLASAQLMKSSSLEEPYNNRPGQSPSGLVRNYSAQPTSPDLPMTQIKCYANSCTPEPSTNSRSMVVDNRGSADSSAPQGNNMVYLDASSSIHQSTLQRQPSVLEYTPDFELQSTDSMTRQTPIGSSYPDGSCTADCRRVDCTVDASLGQRVADLAEKFLTQPARLFSCQESWSPGRRRVLVQRSASGVQDNSIFVQGAIFCLFILAMNFVLRLGDEISRVLIDVLTFKSSTDDLGDRQACPSLANVNN